MDRDEDTIEETRNQHKKRNCKSKIMLMINMRESMYTNTAMVIELYEKEGTEEEILFLSRKCVVYK